MALSPCTGIVKDNTVILQDGATLPEGTPVLVTPMEALPGSPQAVLAAMKAPPHLKPEDVDEFERLIEAGQRPVSYENPLARETRQEPTVTPTAV